MLSLPKTVPKIFVISAPQSDTSVFFLPLGGEINFFPPLEKIRPSRKIHKNSRRSTKVTKARRRRRWILGFFPPSEKRKKILSDI